MEKAKLLTALDGLIDQMRQGKQNAAGPEQVKSFDEYLEALAVGRVLLQTGTGITAHRELLEKLRAQLESSNVRMVNHNSMMQALQEAIRSCSAGREWPERPYPVSGKVREDGGTVYACACRHELYDGQAYCDLCGQRIEWKHIVNI